MPKSIVNLTKLVIDAEIEQILEIHYHSPHQNIFANLGLRQELAAYVLARTRNVHIAVEQGEESRLNVETMPYLTEAKLQIEEFIHHGIQQLHIKTVLGTAKDLLKVE
jgi:DNA-binding GntR family transcriptional regulator